MIKYECTICTFEASKVKELNDHIASSHLQGINCPNDECDFLAENQLELKVHRENTHDRPQNLKCDLCEFTGLNEIILKEHKLWTHKFNYTCETCEYSCPVRYDMTVLLRRHMGQE